MREIGSTLLYDGEPCTVHGYTYYQGDKFYVCVTEDGSQIDVYDSDDCDNDYGEDENDDGDW